MNIIRFAAPVALAVVFVQFGCASSNPAKGDQAASEVAQAADQPVEDQADDKAERQIPLRKDLPVAAVGPVARIDGVAISAEHFNEHIGLRSGSMGTKMPAQLAERLKNSTLDRLIDQALIDRALDKERASLSVTPAQIDAEFQSFVDRFPNEASFQKFLEGNGLTEEKMRENIRKDLELRQFLRARYDLEVTEADALTFYENNLDRFEQEKQVRARHILIKVDEQASQNEVDQARARAEELTKQARAPDADFAELASEHSEGPTASRGGDLNYFTRARMIPAFSDAAFSMTPGNVSDPVRTQYGFHVIYVEDVKPAGQTPFVEVRDRITEQLERQGFRAAVKTLLGSLKADAQIEKLPENIVVNVKAAPKGSAGQGFPPELLKKLEERKRQQQQNPNQPNTAP